MIKKTTTLKQKNNNKSNKSEKKKFSQKHPRISLIIKICLYYNQLFYKNTKLKGEILYEEKNHI